MSSFLDRSKSLARKSNPSSSTPSAAHHSHHKPEGGRPSDHLINRGEQWRLNVKAVHDFYATIAASERHAAAELEKAASSLPLPFVHGAQFNQEEGGWQRALVLRDHAHSSQTLSSACGTRRARSPRSTSGSLRRSRARSSPT